MSAKKREAHFFIRHQRVKLDPKLPSLVGNLHNVRPLEEMIFFSLLIDLDAWESIGNQVGLTLIILWREEGEGGREREGGRGREEAYFL